DRPRLGPALAPPVPFLQPDRRPRPPQGPVRGDGRRLPAGRSGGGGGARLLVESEDAHRAPSRDAPLGGLRPGQLRRRASPAGARRRTALFASATIGSSSRPALLRARYPTPRC